jgi:hypothetical protein
MVGPLFHPNTLLRVTNFNGLPIPLAAQSQIEDSDSALDWKFVRDVLRKLMEWIRRYHKVRKDFKKYLQIEDVKVRTDT